MKSFVAAVCSKVIWNILALVFKVYGLFSRFALPPLFESFCLMFFFSPLHIFFTNSLTEKTWKCGHCTHLTHTEDIRVLATVAPIVPQMATDFHIIRDRSLDLWHRYGNQCKQISFGICCHDSGLSCDILKIRKSIMSGVDFLEITIVTKNRSRLLRIRPEPQKKSLSPSCH